MQKILIVSPEYPPIRGGVSDHTKNLRNALEPFVEEVKVLTSAGLGIGETDIVAPVISNWHSYQEMVCAVENFGKNWTILWQYVPHMYGRYGVNFTIPRIVKELNRRGYVQAMIAHEIAASFALRPSFMLSSICHRLQWASIVGCFRAIGVSTEAWLLRFSNSLGRSERTFLCPSPSNIRKFCLSQTTRAAWCKKLGLDPLKPIVGSFGLSADSYQVTALNRVGELLEEKQLPVSILCVGGKSDLLRSDVQQVGFLSEKEVSVYLQNLDVLILPFVDGVSERRTSFMAGLSHGCPLVTTVGESTGASLRSLDAIETVDSNSPEMIAETVHQLLLNPKRRESVSHKCFQAYRSQFDWKVVAERILMEIVNSDASN